MKFLLHPYYILNTLLCLIYPIYRAYITHSNSKLFQHSVVFQKEGHIVGSILALMTMRFLRYYSTFPKFLCDAFFYLKFANFLVMVLISYVLAAWYSVLIISNT